MTLTRRYRFCASHRLDIPQLHPEENQRLYGKCNNPYGHGHDYILDVTVEGAPDSSGQVVNREQLDLLVKERVLERLDHRNLNLDVSELAGVVPTTENLAAAIENSLLLNWTIGPRLKKIRISETARNMFELENKNA